MKSFQQFIAEAYDKELEGQASRAPGEGGRIRTSRKKRDIDKTRVKALTLVLSISLFLRDVRIRPPSPGALDA